MRERGDVKILFQRKHVIGKHNYFVTARFMESVNKNVMSNTKHTKLSIKYIPYQEFTRSKFNWVHYIQKLFLPDE